MSNKYIFIYIDTDYLYTPIFIDTDRQKLNSIPFFDKFKLRNSKYGLRLYG